jgi:ATP phosphoribosyltransferase regulatory subunit HisZ
MTTWTQATITRHEDQGQEAYVIAVREGDLDIAAQGPTLADAARRFEATLALDLGWVRAFPRPEWAKPKPAIAPHAVHP